MTPSEPKEKLGSAPLTIFYGGNVNVFNDVSVEMVTTESICVQKCLEHDLDDILGVNNKARDWP